MYCLQRLWQGLKRLKRLKLSKTLKHSKTLKTLFKNSKTLKPLFKNYKTLKHSKTLKRSKTRKPLFRNSKKKFFQNLFFRPYIKKSFPSKRASHLDSASRKIKFQFHWIWYIWHYTYLFSGESRPIFPFVWIEIRLYPTLWSASTIEIHFTWYVENVKLFLSQKSRFHFVEEIKNKDKNRTCRSLFQSSEDE